MDLTKAVSRKLCAASRRYEIGISGTANAIGVTFTPRFKLSKVVIYRLRNMCDD